MPTTPAERHQAEQIIAAVEEALHVPTSYRDDTPTPAVGSTPPVPQPGRPPMSQKATDASALMLAVGAASVPVGGMTSLVLYTLGHVDPVQLAIGGAVPVCFVVAVGFVVRSLRGVHTEHHHHYEGTVFQDQRSTRTQTRGFVAKTVNKQQSS